MEGKIDIYLKQFFSISPWLPFHHPHLHLLLCRKLTGAGALCPWLARAENPGVSEHLSSPKTFRGSACPARAPLSPPHGSFLVACVALDFLGRVTESAVRIQAGPGPVAAVNCSDCRRRRDPFSDPDEKGLLSLLQVQKP